MSINKKFLNSSFNNKNDNIMLLKWKNRTNNKFRPIVTIRNFEYEQNDQPPNELLSRILDTIDFNSLNVFYQDSNSDFKKKIDSLNLEFYLETEKFLSNKNPSAKCQTSLFIILFKQINTYLEEIERLNLILMEERYNPIKIKERTDEYIKKKNEFITKENLIKALKESKSNLENKLLVAIINQNKLKKEIEILKKEKENYKSQISRNNISEINQKIQKINSFYNLNHHPLLSEQNCITPYEIKKRILINKRTTARNNSNNNKFNLSNSLNKLYKNRYLKFKIKNQLNKSINQKTISSIKIQKKIQFNENQSYRSLYTESNKIQINNDNNNNATNNLKKFITKIKEKTYVEKGKDDKNKNKKIYIRTENKGKTMNKKIKI